MKPSHGTLAVGVEPPEHSVGAALGVEILGGHCGVDAGSAGTLAEGLEVEKEH